MKLWKYNRITGYWILQRICDAATAAAWLSVYAADEPNETFRASNRRPVGAP